ncbi:flagellar export chaperone FliS [Arthrobacter sp. I2-34]|uniref:Flagellar secretion chaperone FliS n=1 Tax=Arthrobacter hankyongi TaxID=2904801 RepID=A0ABS9L4L9_9MICC|nr:flagellar export chaperone FliS [Arthrobacter hankyongi]MCG2621625.1 flagellar export chaperone FliS [Arthrobacter hankyongi]
MNMMGNAQAKLNQYQRDAILSASPARLLTMLYDRLMLDLARAEEAQEAQQWSVASDNLLHAQAIVTELTITLDTTAWDGADGLLALYNYVSQTLISANIHRNVERTRECIRLLEPLRQAWHEAAGDVPALAAQQAFAQPVGELGIA